MSGYETVYPMSDQDPCFPVCSTCDGKGSYVVQSSRGELETDTLVCPSCVSGAVITDELRKVVTDTLWDTADRRHYEQADAVLAAVVTHLKSEEQS